MKQLEDVIDKDEYDRSNFEEKILKREESMNEDNHQIINEDPEVNPIDQKLIQMGSSKKSKTSNSNLDNRPIWGSNTLKNKKNKARESYKESKVINDQNINKKVEDKKKKNIKLRKEREKVKEKHNELAKVLINKVDELNKVSKEKEDLSKYLFKIEKVVKGATGAAQGSTVKTFSEKDNLEDIGKNFEAFDSQSLTINISGGSPNVIMEDEKGEKIIIISKKDLMKYLNKLYKVNHMMIKIIVAGFQELCLNSPSDKETFQDVEEKLNEVKV